MYTHWSLMPLFQELRDQVEVFDFSKYNFVTTIMKPASMTQGELLNGVMKSYRRFYMRKAFFHYPWRGTGFRRNYPLGCLKAFLKVGLGRTFYDLGKAGYWGSQSKAKVDFHFDETHTIAEGQMEECGATANPLAYGARSAPGCYWHAAVFERLYDTLLWPSVQGQETTYCASGDTACRFEIGPVA